MLLDILHDFESFLNDSDDNGWSDSDSDEDADAAADEGGEAAAEVGAPTGQVSEDPVLTWEEVVARAAKAERDEKLIAQCYEGELDDGVACASMPQYRTAQRKDYLTTFLPILI